MINTLEPERQIDEYTIQRALARHIRRASSGRRFNSKRARERANLAAKYGNRCFYCLREFSNSFIATIDHFFPEAFCKANGMPKSLWDNISNKVLACESCNQLKSCSVPRLEMYYEWLRGVINDARTNEDVIALAKQFIHRVNFIFPYSNSENELVDDETMAMDRWLGCNA